MANDAVIKNDQDAISEIKIPTDTLSQIYQFSELKDQLSLRLVSTAHERGFQLIINAEMVVKKILPLMHTPFITNSGIKERHLYQAALYRQLNFFRETDYINKIALDLNAARDIHTHDLLSFLIIADDLSNLKSIHLEAIKEMLNQNNSIIDVIYYRECVAFQATLDPVTVDGVDVTIDWDDQKKAKCEQRQHTGNLNTIKNSLKLSCAGAAFSLKNSAENPNQANLNILKQDFLHLMQQVFPPGEGRLAGQTGNIYCYATYINLAKLNLSNMTAKDQSLVLMNANLSGTDLSNNKFDALLQCRLAENTLDGITVKYDFRFNTSGANMPGDNLLDPSELTLSNINNLLGFDFGQYFQGAQTVQEVTQLIANSIIDGVKDKPDEREILEKALAHKLFAQSIEDNIKNKIDSLCKNLNNFFSNENTNLIPTAPRDILLARLNFLSTSNCRLQ